MVGSWFIREFYLVALALDSFPAMVSYSLLNSPATLVLFNQLCKQSSQTSWSIGLVVISSDYHNYQPFFGNPIHSRAWLPFHNPTPCARNAGFTYAGNISKTWNMGLCNLRSIVYRLVDPRRISASAITG